MVKQTLLAAFMAVSLTGCFSFIQPEPEVITEVETQEVFIPVPADIDLPDELEDPYETSSRPEFVSTEHEDAKVALTSEGINKFQLMILEMKKRIRLWEATYGVGESEEEEKNGKSD